MTKYVSLEHAIRNAVRDQNYKKVNEDFEFEMARNELRTAIDAAKRLMAQLDGEGELEAWVQSKITKGADYLDTVADYMDSRDTKKLKEETKELIETMSVVNSKFKGNDFTTPVRIAPTVTKAAIKTAGHRRIQKQQDSATMQGKIVEAKKEEKEDGDSDNWATRYAKGLWQAGKDVVSGAPEAVSSTQGAEAAVKGAVHGFTGKDEPVDPSEIGDISRVGVEASRKLGGKYGPAARKDKDTEVKASVDAYTPMYNKEKENVEKLQQEKPDAYKAGKAIGQYGPDVASMYSLGKWGLSKLKSKPAVEPPVAPKSVEPTPTPTPKAVPEPSAPKTVETPTPASTAKDLVPPQFKATEAPKPASDNIPGGAKPPAEPVTPKSAPPEPMQPAGKKPPANQNLEPEVKGTGTEGLPAPKPQTAEPPRPQKPYDTGVKVTKEPPPTPANVNKPDVVPQGTPSPGGATPLPGVKITNTPVGPKPANMPEPATAPAPAKMPIKTPEPATAPAPKQATSPTPATVQAPKPVPRVRPQPRVRPGAGRPAPAGAGPKPLPPRRPFPIPLPSSSNTSEYKAPPPHSEYHDVPVKTSVSQAQAHRKFATNQLARFRAFREETGPDNTRRKDSSKELVGRPDSAGVKDPKSVLARNGSIKTKIIDEQNKLAGVVKSVVKKKKEEKESGPNPLVDFEPKLNHKYDNET